MTILRKSLHETFYNLKEQNIDFNISKKNFIPDIILYDKNLVLKTDLLCKNNISISKLDFHLENENLNVDTKSFLFNKYEWLTNNISINELLKGLFGEFLDENSNIFITRDESKKNIISNASLISLLNKPNHFEEELSYYWPKKYYLLEHKLLLNKLSNLFFKIFSKKENINLYKKSYKIDENSDIFKSGDIFEVPVHLTFNYSFKKQNITLNDFKNLTPLRINTEKSKTYKILYKFIIK